MKHRQLRLLGYALVLVPYWEWEEACAGGGGGGRAYLVRKLEEALLRSAGVAGQEGDTEGLRRAGEAAAGREVWGRRTRQRKNKKAEPSAEASAEAKDGGNKQHHHRHGGDERAARKSHKGGVEVALDKEETDLEVSEAGQERKTRAGKRIGGSAQGREVGEDSARQDAASEKRHARKRKKQKTE